MDAGAAATQYECCGHKTVACLSASVIRDFLPVFLRGAPEEAMARGTREPRAGEVVSASHWQGEPITSTVAAMDAASAR